MQLQHLFNAVDTDQSGFIDYNEFVAATIDAQKVLNKEKLRNIFRMIDKDNSGKISLKEIRATLGATKKGGEEFFENLIEKAGIQEQEIEYNQFYRIIMKDDKKTNMTSKISYKKFKQILGTKNLDLLVDMSDAAAPLTTQSPRSGK